MKYQLEKMNDFLLHFSKYWYLDGDLLRCKKCNRGCIASRQDDDFIHQAGCNGGGGVSKPWIKLVEILGPVASYTPQIVRDLMAHIDELQIQILQNTKKLKMVHRAIEMLEVSAEYIDKTDPYGTINYDGADCDGGCVAEDCRSIAESLRKS